MTLRVLVVGSAGRLGRLVCEEFSSAGCNLTALTRADLDITNADAVRRAISDHGSHVVINCAAYNAVDAAEKDRASAFAINAEGPGILAAAAHAAGARFVHYGTDFVFDGKSPTPYRECDLVNPLGAYGASKLAGEVAVQNASPNYYILRIASLFGGTGVHGHRATTDYIVDTLLAGDLVKAVIDRTVSPSYAPDVARATRALIERSGPFGTYHCVNSGWTTWLELARYVASQLGVEESIQGIEAASLSTPAPRPQYCALSNQKLKAIVELPEWQDAVARHIARRATVAALK